MKILMVSYTVRGTEKMDEAARKLLFADPMHRIETAVRCKALPDRSILGNMKDYVSDRFSEVDAIVFFAATGIAVRTIAPLIKDKFTDPAVCVIDETGRYCISLLSGHVGGANHLCAQLAELLGAEPVITTATDREGLFSIDSYAAEKHLVLTDREKAKEISARILNGEVISIYGAGETEEFPPCIRKTTSPDADVVISEREIRADEPAAAEGEQPPETPAGWNVGTKPSARLSIAGAALPVGHHPLQLVPRTLAVGIGCRRGISKEKIAAAVREVLHESGYSIHAISVIASIDVKQNEAGLIAFAEELGVPFVTFSAEELMAVEGEFSSSEFVRSKVGVDNVCERSAVLAGSSGARADSAARAGRADCEARQDSAKTAHDQANAGCGDSPRAPALAGSTDLVHRKFAKDGVTVAIARKN